MARTSDTTQGPSRFAVRLLMVVVVAIGASAPSLAASLVEEAVGLRFAIAMHGEPKYGQDFKHFDYVNPDAPKGGTITVSWFGGFDTLNPFSIKGRTAAGLGYVFATLMAPAMDEPFSRYPLLAESVRTPQDCSWVEFRLDARARFHDGRPVRAQDVAFSFRALKQANPFYAAYYASVERVHVLDERTVRFEFAPGENRELPLILGQFPVLPRHWWEGRDVSAGTLDPPIGSGPYRIAFVVPGRSIAYERVDDYWARDLPVNRGRFNFARIEYDYYLDESVALEAFRAGLVDFRIEWSAKDWATGYDIPAVRDGRIVLEEVEIGTPAGMQAFVFNTRRPVFADPRVRRAIGHAFDFPWVNQVLFHGTYERTDSYFEHSELAAEGTPGPAELALLEPLRGELPAEVFSRDYDPPGPDHRRGMREALLKAKKLLEQAGWIIRDGWRVNARTGRPLAFEILLAYPAFERVALPLVDSLRRLGITASVRTVDTAQYQNRIRRFDFDMIVHGWGQPLSPGNEQRYNWTSDAADTPGSGNLAGIRSPAVDRLVELLIQADTWEELRTRARALDRVLLWGHYVIPHWFSDHLRIAYWERLARPERMPAYGIVFDTWWVRPSAVGKMAAGEAMLQVR